MVISYLLRPTITKWLKTTMVPIDLYIYLSPIVFGLKLKAHIGTAEGPTHRLKTNRSRVNGCRGFAKQVRLYVALQIHLVKLPK